MAETGPGAEDPHPRARVSADGLSISYAALGQGPPIVCLHGNPTYSYLWRNVLPDLAAAGRRGLAPDLPGMGASDPDPAGDYRFARHMAALDAWFEALGLSADVVLVGHDWGGALAMSWARRHPDRVQGLVFLETMAEPLTWHDFPDSARDLFRGFRSEAGERMILEDNVFVEQVLPFATQRSLSTAEMDAYRAPYRAGGESRRAMLTWPREIPIDGVPAEVHEVLAANRDFMRASPLPKLFINAEPGLILTGRQRETARSFANLDEVTVAGLHYLPEDAPGEIAAAITDFLRRL